MAPLLGIGTQTLGRYLDRAVARGLALMEDHSYRFLPEAFSPGGRVLRKSRPVASRFIGASAANSLARLGKAYSSGSFADSPFFLGAYRGLFTSLPEESARGDLRLGRDIGAVIAYRTSDGRLLFRFAESVDPSSFKWYAHRRPGVSDTAFLRTLEAARLHYGSGLFSVGKLVDDFDLGESRARHYLDRAIVRGAVIEDVGGYRFVPEAALEEARPIASSFVNRSIVGAVSRLERARSSIEGDFLLGHYQEFAQVSRPRAMEDLRLGSDLGVVESVGERGVGRSLFYRFRETAGDALRSFRAVSKVSGPPKGKFFPTLEEFYFGVDGGRFSSLRFRRSVGPTMFRQYLDRAIVRGLVVRDRSGYRFALGALDSSGKMTERRLPVASSLVDGRLAAVFTRLEQLRDSGHFADYFTREQYGRYHRVGRSRASRELGLGADLGLVKMGRTYSTIVYRFDGDVVIPPVLLGRQP